MTDQDRLLQAMDRYQAGDIAEAARLVRDVLEEEPSNVDALHIAGLVAYRSGNTDTAIRLLATALNLAPDFATAHANLAKIYDEAGMPNEAHFHYGKAMELEPGNAEATSRHEELGQGMQTMSIADALSHACDLHQQGKLDDASIVYEAVLREQPANTDALHLLGIARIQQGFPQEGIELIQQAIAIAPKVASFHFNLANAYRSIGRIEEADTAEAKGHELQNTLT